MHKNILKTPSYWLQNILCLVCVSRDLCRFHSIRHDLQELQHPAVAHHPLPRAGLSVRRAAVQRLGPGELPTDVSLHSLWAGAPPHRDLQLTGQAGHRPPGPEEPQHPGQEE